MYPTDKALHKTLISYLEISLQRLETILDSLLRETN